MIITTTRLYAARHVMMKKKKKKKKFPALGMTISTCSIEVSRVSLNKAAGEYTAPANYREKKAAVVYCHSGFLFS